MNTDALLSCFGKNSTLDLSELEGKELLFTGGSGVVVLNLVMQILQHNIQFSRLVLSYRTSFPGQIENYLASHGVTLCRGDLSSVTFEGSFDYIVHGATYGQPGKYLSEKLLTISLNTTELIRISEGLKANGTLLYISSSDVYDGVTSLPIKESDYGLSHPWHTRSAYFESKRCGEAICSAMVNAGRNVKAVRLALGYGPGFKIDDKRVMYEFAFAAIRNRKIKMKDRGQALRTYGHAHDISEMMFNILLRAKQSCYNVGGKSRFSILELANIIADRTGATVEVPEVASSEEQIRNAPGDVWLDLDRYCHEFSKSEFVSIDRGIVDVIDWARMLIEQQ